jgi:hypothetical protein
MATAKVYGLGMQSILNKEVDYDSDTVKVMLCTSSYTPDQDTHRYKSSVTNEVTGTGYTAGGQALTAKTVTYNTSTNTLTLDCADPLWAGATITGIHYAVFYVDTGTAGTSPLLCYMDFTADYSPTVQDFSIVIPGTGIITSTAA